MPLFTCGRLYAEVFCPLLTGDFTLGLQVRLGRNFGPPRVTVGLGVTVLTVGWQDRTDIHGCTGGWFP